MIAKKIFYAIFITLLFLANTSYAKDKMHLQKSNLKQSKQKFRQPANATKAEFKFAYKYKGEKILLKSKSTSYEDAFEKAAKECFQRYKGTRYLTEDEGLDIIDVCANPRS